MNTFCFIIALLFIPFCLSYTRSGSLMTDLTSSNAATFATDAASWTLSSSACGACSKTYLTPPNLCGIPQETIFGGPGILGPSGASTFAQYFERYYPSLNAPDASAALEFDVWVFYATAPSNNDMNILSVVIDEIPSSVVSIASTLEGVCPTPFYTDAGGVAIGVFLKFHVRAFWTTTYLTYTRIRIISLMNAASTVSSFGFRNIKYYLHGSIDTSKQILPDNFPCWRGHFWDGSACTACYNDFCKTCTGTTQADCTSCKNEAFDYGNFNCTDTCASPWKGVTANGVPYTCEPICAAAEFFWFYDQSCSTTCDLPFFSSVDGSGLKICSNPCYYNDATSAYVNKFLYPDQTCLSTCPSPLQTGTPGLCLTPCTNPSIFLFTNGTCKSQCNALLLQTTTNGILYCKSPCSGQYIYGDGSCSTDCSPPFIQVHDSDDIKFCRSPCPNINSYIFRNGSCTNQCISPLLDSSIGGYKLCNSPCAAQYIYLDGTCSTGCDKPLVKFDESDDIKYCRTPCADVNAHIFKNGSCTSTCNSPPLVKSTVKGNKFCNSPCSNQWIYTDGTCSTSCQTPLLQIAESEIKWCRNPCTDVAYYIFVNGTCKSSCNPLLMKSTVKGNNFCKSPCPGKYIYYDGSCQTNCAAPMVKRDESADVKFCTSPCSNPNDYYYEADKKCLSTCGTPYEPKRLYNMNLCYISVDLKVEDVKSTTDMVSGITGANQAGATGGKASASLSSTSPALAFMAGQVSLLFSIRYINVTYPNKLKLMFQLQGTSPFSFSLNFNIPPGVQSDLGKKTLPDVFGQYQVPADFLENFWDSFLTLCLTFVLIFVVSLLERIFVKRFPTIGLILGNLLRMTKWNLPLMILCSAFGDLFFFASLQLQAKGESNTKWEIVSLVLAIFMMIVGVIILILPFKIVKEIQDNEKIAEKKWRDFELLYSGNKRNSTLSFCYMAIFLCITVISNLIITTLHANPLFEAFFITGLSVLMLLFLLIQRPLTEFKMFVQIVINQALLVIVNICVVILAIMDNMETERENVRDRIGQGIIIIFYLSMASGIAFAASEVLFSIWGYYKFIKELRKKGPLSLKRILHALIHGIEEEKEEVAPEKKTTTTTSQKASLPAFEPKDMDILNGRRRLNQWKRLKKSSQNKRDSQDWNNTSEIVLTNQNTEHSLSIISREDSDRRSLSPHLKPPKRNSTIFPAAWLKPQPQKKDQMKEAPKNSFSERAPREIIPTLQPVIPKQIPYNNRSFHDTFYNKPPLKTLKTQQNHAGYYQMESERRSQNHTGNDQMESERRNLNKSPIQKIKADQEVSQPPWESKAYIQKRKNKIFIFN